MSLIRHFRELDVYRTAMDSTMQVFGQIVRMAEQPEKWVIGGRGTA